MDLCKTLILDALMSDALTLDTSTLNTFALNTIGLFEQYDSINALDPAYWSNEFTVIFPRPVL